MHGNLHNINRPEHYTDQVRFFAVHSGIHKCFMFYLCAWDIRFLCSYNAHESFYAKTLYIALFGERCEQTTCLCGFTLKFLCTDIQSLYRPSLFRLFRPGSVAVNLITDVLSTIIELTCWLKSSNKLSRQKRNSEEWFINKRKYMKC